MTKCKKCGASVYIRQVDGVIMERIWNYEYEDYGNGGDGSAFWDDPHKCRKVLIHKPADARPSTQMREHREF